MRTHIHTLPLKSNCELTCPPIGRATMEEDPARPEVVVVAGDEFNILLISDDASFFSTVVGGASSGRESICSTVGCDDDGTLPLQPELVCSLSCFNSTAI